VLGFERLASGRAALLGSAEIAGHPNGPTRGDQKKKTPRDGKNKLKKEEDKRAPS